MSTAFLLHAARLCGCAVAGGENVQTSCWNGNLAFLDRVRVLANTEFRGQGNADHRASLRDLSADRSREGCRVGSPIETSRLILKCPARNGRKNEEGARGNRAPSVSNRPNLKLWLHRQQGWNRWGQEASIERPGLPQSLQKPIFSNCRSPAVRNNRRGNPCNTHRFRPASNWKALCRFGEVSRHADTLPLSSMSSHSDWQLAPLYLPAGCHSLRHHRLPT